MIVARPDGGRLRIGNARRVRLPGKETVPQAEIENVVPISQRVVHPIPERGSGTREIVDRPTVYRLGPVIVDVVRQYRQAQAPRNASESQSIHVCRPVDLNVDACGLQHPAVHVDEPDGAGIACAGITADALTEFLLRIIPWIELRIEALLIRLVEAESANRPLHM